MKVLRAILALFIEPIVYIAKGLLAMAALMWVLSGFGILFLLGCIADHGRLTLFGWVIIGIDAVLLIIYSIQFVKEKIQEYE